ncbi:MAG: sulfurtransferase tusA [Pelagibacteraceae bacterium]|nr:sulfurtransferase tusA [Pelagibacteraceae bacterium]|tara:strand:- start:75 stop:323 length:249 start_codon:yes stop_codon:yes gene_type:complete
MKYKSKKNEVILDVRGLECPIPVLRARKLAQSANNGDKIKVICTDPLAEVDFQHYCKQEKYKYIGCLKENDQITIEYEIVSN